MRRNLAIPALAALLTLAAFAPCAQGAAGPLWDVKASWGPTDLAPGGNGQFQLQARNLGDEATEERLTITDVLPTGVTATAIHWGTSGANPPTSTCSGVGTEEVSCSLEGAELAALSTPFPADLEFKGYLPTIYVDVQVGAGASGTAVNRASVEGGGSARFEESRQVSFGSTPPSFGVAPSSFEADLFNAAYPFGSPERQAGSHPFELRVGFELDQESGVGPDGTRYLAANGLLKTVVARMPRGFIGNPEAAPKCDAVQFAEEGSTQNSTGCPADTQVGYLDAALFIGTKKYGSQQANGSLSENSPNGFGAKVPIYNLMPPHGQPADFGFNVAGYVQGHIYANLDPAHDYAIKTVTPEISALQGLRVRYSDVTFWGVPADPAHDPLRFYPKETEGKVVGAPWGSAPIRPLLTEPSDCGVENGAAAIQVESYEESGVLSPELGAPSSLDVEGCTDPRFSFAPKIALQPTALEAGAPTGLAVHLEVPQQNDEAEKAAELYSEDPEDGLKHVKAIATPPIEKAVVTFPEGMTLNPSAAQGLASCSAAEVGLGTDQPVRCPQASQYGTLIIHTPILPANAPPEGHIYIGPQTNSPFSLTIYLVIEEPDRGILVKLPGKVTLNETTGQITTSFEDLPQFPVSDMQMSLKGGVRAGLVNPGTCGKKTISAQFFTWQDPNTPHSVESSFEVTRKPDGSPCFASLAERPFSPSLEAGTANNAAGTYSPYGLRVTRVDEEQELSRLAMKLPEGLLGSIAGVGLCPQSGIEQAEARTGAGQGALEQADPSCPASSRVGSIEAGTGVGVPLTYVPGTIYLAGPYEGAPLSVVVITPAVVGPFDLGVVTVRTALHVDPETARVSASSDALPLIFHGVLVRLRDLHLDLDRPHFTLNPTSCAEKQIETHIEGTEGRSADPKQRFQAADCAALGFKPKLYFRLLGPHGRGGHPQLRAVVKMPRRGANIARASVALPHSEFLDQSHIRTICTRVQFSAHQCPAGSVYGHAVARTPLFGTPLEGPVYLRSSSHKLPDLVAVLKGPPSEPVEFDLDGRIDSIHGGIRNTFSFVPDAPVESFVLTMQGAKKGLLENSTDLCAHVHRATAKFGAWNGKQALLRPAMRAQCGNAHTKAHRKHR